MASAREALAIGLGGGLASVFARLLVYPVDVLRTVYVTKGRGGVRALGLIDLYRGLYPAMVDAFAYHAANFGIYELLKGVYFRLVSRSASIGAPLPPLVGLGLGMVSGAVGMVLCYPFTTVVLRMSSEQESATAATRKIVQADGLFGLWRGLLAGLLMAPRPGLAFVVVELLQPFFVRARGGLPPTPFLNFMTGAIADCVSTAAVWPLAFARIQTAVGDRDESKEAQVQRRRQSAVRVSTIYAHEIPIACVSGHIGMRLATAHHCLARHIAFARDSLCLNPLRPVAARAHRSNAERRDP